MFSIVSAKQDGRRVRVGRGNRAPVCLFARRFFSQFKLGGATTLVALPWLLAPLLAAEPAEVVVRNARIYTVNPKAPVAKEMAIAKGRIVAIGAEVKAHVGPGTRVVDLGGAAVIPGLIDSHVHMENFGFMLETFDLRDVKSVAEVAGMVKARAAQRAAGEWIQGRSWDQTNWGGEFPTHHALTEAAPNHPVYLTRVDGHAGWVNQKAMEIAGITKDTPDPMGGKIIRDKDGNPTGVLIDRAQGLVGSKIPRPSDARAKERIRLAAQACARLGLTSVHDAGVDAQDLRAYRELIAEGQMPVRVYAMIGGAGQLWKEYLERGPELGEFLTVRSIKLMGDGAMGSRGAAFWQPYADDPGNTGLMLIRGEEVEAVARQAVAKGFQVNTHAIGDRANRVVLDAYGKVLGPGNTKRFRIEHAQAVSLPDFARFKEFAVIASMQSTHATSDMRWAEKRLGPDRLLGAYAWQRMLKAGVRVANGSDFPVEQPNPLLGFYAAITRQDLEGKPEGGWTPSERMTREQALESFTLAGAYAAFEEAEKGSLEPGKMADFLVLSADIMTIPPLQIPKVTIQQTYVGGKLVHSARN